MKHQHSASSVKQEVPGAKMTAIKLLARPGRQVVPSWKCLLSLSLSLSLPQRTGRDFLGQRPVPCYPRQAQDIILFINWLSSNLKLVRFHAASIWTGTLSVDLTHLMAGSFVLISSLNLFMYSLYTFVLVPALSQSLHPP